MKRHPGYVLTALMTLATAAAAIERGSYISDAGLVPYASGGVGKEEAEALLAAAERYNLRVTLATTTDQYLAGVRLRIVDEQGLTWLELPSAGPLVYSVLPPGEYTIQGVANGEPRSATARLGVTSEAVALSLVWPASALGAEPDSRAAERGAVRTARPPEPPARP